MADEVVVLTVQLPRPTTEQVVLAVAFTSSEGSVLVTHTTMAREVLEHEYLGEALAQAVRAGIQVGEQDLVMHEHAATAPSDS